MKKSQQITAAQRKAILARDAGSCRRCGINLHHLPHSIHHRINRGMGGTRRPSTLAELVLLCGTGTTGCHGEITEHPAESYDTGWLIHRNNPATADMIPLTDLLGREFFLTDDGGVNYVTGGGRVVTA